MEEFLIMRGFDLGVFAALWTLFSRFACGQHVGGGEASTYSRELLLALRPLAVSDNILHIPRSLRINSLQAAASGILSKKQRRKRGRRGGIQRRLRKYGLVRPHQTRISRTFYARYARKMLLDHFVSKMVAYAQYALYAPTSLA